ncbi:MAG: rod shape-determining protein MreD [Oscillospiraceae bacterium]|nr:rod shape-determining protein MreD [Oscillospiraceae bacterium]
MKVEFGKNARAVLKWGIYLLLLLLLCGLQGAPGLFAVWGVKPVFVAPLAVAVAFFEREGASAAFGVAAGFLWDLSAGKLFGFYGMVLLVCCAAVTLLSMYCIRVNLANFLLLCLGVSLLCGLWNFFFYSFIWGYDGALLYFWKALAQTAYTALPAIPIYYLVRWLTDKLSLTVRA